MNRPAKVPDQSGRARRGRKQMGVFECGAVDPWLRSGRRTAGVRGSCPRIGHSKWFARLTATIRLCLCLERLTTRSLSQWTTA